MSRKLSNTLSRGINNNIIIKDKRYWLNNNDLIIKISKMWIKCLSSVSTFCETQTFCPKMLIL